MAEEEILAEVAAPPPTLDEAAALWWREDVTAATLRRDDRRWTVWTAWLVAVFVAPGALLLYLEPLTLPVAAICFAHAWLIPWIQARRGAEQVTPLGTPSSGADRVAIGLLGDLLDHAERDLLLRSGLAIQLGELGTWLVGERGAFLVRPGGRRVECWCVRVGDASELPGADRIAHLLLGLREDELGFAKIANLSFSGATWRVRSRLDAGARQGLDAARQLARRR